MASVIYQGMFIANISFFYKFDNLAAILNIIAYYIQAQPEMHVYLNFYVRTHHKESLTHSSLAVLTFVWSGHFCYFETHSHTLKINLE